MARNQVDTIDVGALTIVPIAAAMVLGVFALNISVFGIGSLSQPIVGSGTSAITIPLVLYLGGLGWIVGTNELDGSDYEDYELALIGFAFLSVPMYVFVPVFADLVGISDVIRLLLALGISAAAVLISYVE
ncbi:hypothetical protein L593_14405 [Salinarchaeum sp. Harcht-Bsk1]|nr:hypothetical protein L593_14405 [Salinarchaeum sp. Harcht-Bsk1]